MFLRDKSHKIVNVNAMQHFYKKIPYSRLQEGETHYYFCAESIKGDEFYLKDFETKKELDEYFEMFWEKLNSGINFVVE